MFVIIKTKNIKLTEDLENYINEKISGLEKFVKIFHEEKGNKFLASERKKGKPLSEIFVEIEKETQHHQKGRVFRAEAQLHLPGKHLRAEAKSEDIKAGIDEVKDELYRQLKHYSETHSIYRR